VSSKVEAMYFDPPEGRRTRPYQRQAIRGCEPDRSRRKINEDMGNGVLAHGQTLIQKGGVSMSKKLTEGEYSTSG